METINWTPEMLEQFVTALEEAEAAQAMEFSFMGHPFVPSYARHLVTYLQHAFDDADPNLH
jgi:hypothetical protein